MLSLAIGLAVFAFLAAALFRPWVANPAGFAYFCGWAALSLAALLFRRFVAAAFLQAAAFAFMLLLVFGLAMERPTRDPVKLQWIEAEARILMAAYPAGMSDVPQERWPWYIARLEPWHVSVDERGVDIATKAFFDGGWGYFVPRSARDTPEPGWRYEEAGEGVYWWHPY